MGLTLSQPIAIARGILNDTVPDSDGVYRYSDADLLTYGNGAIRALATLKASYLYATGELTCVTGKAMQSVTFNDAHALVSVDSVKNGDAVLPADKAALDAFMPGWMNATPSAAKNWMPHGDNPVAFWIHPPAPAAQILNVTYIMVPPIYTVNQDTGLPLTLIEAIAEYIVGIAESRDDEHVLSGRAAVFTSRLAERLGLTVPKG